MATLLVSRTAVISHDYGTASQSDVVGLGVGGSRSRFEEVSAASWDGGPRASDASDDFERLGAVGWRPVVGSWWSEGGTSLRGEAERGTALALAVREAAGPLAAGAVTATVVVTAGEKARVVLGLQDHESYVYAEAATDAWRIGRVVDGVETVLSSSGSGTPGPGQATSMRPHLLGLMFLQNVLLSC